MTQTFDTSRVGGGTYELEQDASGNYKLKSVGFAQVNKLNLPDLATSDTTTTTPKKEEEKKTEVADPYKKLFKQTEGGGGQDARTFQDYERIIPKDAEVKDASQPMAKERLTESFAGEEKPTQTYAEQLANIQRGQMTDANIGFGEQKLDTEKFKGSTTGTLADPLEKQDVKPERTTGLQKVRSKATDTVSKVKKAIGNVANVLLPGGLLRAMVSPQQKALNKSNKDALSSLGYKTRGELGGSTDPGRIAGNPATNVFAGMNAQSAFGDPMRGARKRVSTITKTIERKKAAGKDTTNLENRKKEFNRQIEEVQAKKNKADLATGGVAPGASGGGGGSGGCFLKGTLITMLDGTTKTVEQVDLGDKVAVGGKVFAVGRFLNTELYDYKGIKVSGSHMVNEDGVWVRVRDTKHGKSLGDDLNTVYVFGSENRRILINNILFTDYFEVSEQDQLINNEKDFFNNWKSYENTIDEHNVNTLNGS